jgi:hypothetical protein
MLIVEIHQFSKRQAPPGCLGPDVFFGEAPVGQAPATGSLPSCSHRPKGMSSNKPHMATFNDASLFQLILK